MNSKIIIGPQFRNAEYDSEPRRQGLAQLDEQVEEAAEGGADEYEDVSQRAQAVEDSVALAVSLCDALALIGDPAAIGCARE